MKTILFDGRIGANGTEIKTTKSGKPYARFSVANNTFANGEEKTEWYDVITYDQNFIEKRATYLTKGSYVIINGAIRTEVKIDSSNKVWINHYVTATTIDTPRFGTKSENANQVSDADSTQPALSTFTGNTATVIRENAPTISSQISTTPPPNETVSVASGGMGAVSQSDPDDMPF
jgi:single stranded DNA-binding protein